MAKYTCLFAEYLERGGQLPASFALIANFGDLFKKHYCNYEIGFETELLFYMKLEEKADLVMQIYADRLQRLSAKWTQYDNPIKLVAVTENKKFNAGAQKGKTTELPLNASSAQPNVINDTDAYENTENRGTTTRESGETHDEVMKGIEFLTSRKNLLMQNLLDEFKDLFMVVY